jgi:hypothetical protein
MKAVLSVNAEIRFEGFYNFLKFIFFNFHILRNPAPLGTTPPLKYLYGGKTRDRIVGVCV